MVKTNYVLDDDKSEGFSQIIDKRNADNPDDSGSTAFNQKTINDEIDKEMEFSNQEEEEKIQTMPNNSSN